MKRRAKNVLSSVSPSCSPLKKNIFRQIHVHAMYCSFEQRFGVLSSLFIRTVVVDFSAFLRINYFLVLNTLCERSALPRWQIVFWFNNKQEYSTEPFCKITVLQGHHELAGNLSTGIEILLTIYCYRKLAGSVFTKLFYGWKNELFRLA